MVRVAGLSWLLLASLAAADERPRVLVLKSAELAAYSAVRAGFSAELSRAQVQEAVLPEGAEAAGKAVKQWAASAPALVLAVGPSAANAAKAGFGETPVLFCMVPYFEKYGLEGPHLTGISLTNDVGAELGLLAALAPSASRVGVVHDPRYSARVMEEASAAARKQKLVAVPLGLDGPGGLENLLEGLEGKVDALLLVADKTVASAEVVEGVIARTKELGLPLMGLSQAQVKGGALVALAPSPVGIGQQAGRLASRVLFERVDPGALQVAAPEQLELSVNLGTLRQVLKGAEASDRVLKLAASRGHTLKVFP
jgi:putative ABC transport system substrate-binding protein